jgi:hypothetical protein
MTRLLLTAIAGLLAARAWAGTAAIDVDASKAGPPLTVALENAAGK